MMLMFVVMLTAYGPSAYPVEDLAGIDALAFNQKGELLVLDGRDHAVYIFNPDTTLKRRFGAKGQGPGEFQNPTSMVVLDDGRVVIADPSARRLLFFDSAGEHAHSIPMPDHAVGDIFHAPGNRFLLTRSSPTFTHLRIGEEQGKRFALMTAEGTTVKTFGASREHENPLLAAYLNHGYPVWLGDTLYFFARIENALWVYHDDKEEARPYKAAFRPRTPDATMISKETTDGNTNISMQLDYDAVCSAAVPWGGDRMLLMRAVGPADEEDSLIYQLAVMKSDGHAETVLPDRFEGTRALVVAPDNQHALVAHDGEESWVLKKVALPRR